MKSFFKNILLLAVVLLLSYFMAEYFGAWYDKFSPQNSSSFLGLGKEVSLIVAGFPFAHIFFTVLFFQFINLADKNKWTIWLLIPAFLFFGSTDIRHIYLPIILGLFAFGLAIVLQKIFKNLVRW